MQPPEPNQPQQQFDPQQPAPGYGSENPSPEGAQAPLPPGIPAFNEPLPPQGYAPQSYAQQGLPPQGYAPPSGYPGGYGPPPPSVRFDAIGEAWKLFQAEMMTWVLAVFIVGLIACAVMAVGLVLILPGAMAPQPKDPALILTRFAGQLVAQTIFGIVFGVVGQMLNGGLMRMAIRQVRGYKISVGDIFNIGDVFLPLLGAALIVQVCTTIGSMLCYVPGFIAMGTLMFAVPLVVDGGLGAGAAVSKSWDTLKAHLWPATGFYLVAVIVAELGLIACGVGAFFTAPLLPLSIAILYRDFFINPLQGQIAPTSTDAGQGPPIPDPHAY